jgi:hypothetical protein
MTDSNVPALYVLDTCCWIDAVHPDHHACVAVRRILAHADAGAIRVAVSRHSLDQLQRAAQRHADGALELAERYECLPCYPFGSIEDLVGPIEGLGGTLGDIGASDALDAKLKELAKQSVDLRDRGAVLDAYRANGTAFVTSDVGVAGSGPAARIFAALGFRVQAPKDVAQALGSRARLTGRLTNGVDEVTGRRLRRNGLTRRADPRDRVGTGSP